MSDDSFLSETLHSLRKEVNHLATEDVSSVLSGVSKLVEKEVSENPYRFIAAALGLGFGLGSLNRGHAKSAAIHLGKLVAMKAISNMETRDLNTQTPIPTHEGGEHAQQQKQLPA